MDRPEPVEPPPPPVVKSSSFPYSPSATINPHIPSSPPLNPLPSPADPTPLSPGQLKLAKRMQEIAKIAAKVEDPWAKYNIANRPMERIKRHQYNPDADSWSTDESIVRVEDKPFDEGAMRQCYRMKKLSQLPKDATNHSFHKIDWNSAPNYVAKTYKTPDGSVNTSKESREACFGDIKLQYEAAHWAHTFNASNPPKKIHIIRAYAIEFVDRDESPIMTVERFIEGTDEYGVGYVKHNTNSGFVDHDMSRLTPQIFSAFSFYSSEGTRMVVDIQGVGDLYTDPQVHSIDLRFGEADLGLRGFALFFRSFKHETLATALGVPRFELSRNELVFQNERGSTTSSLPQPPAPPKPEPNDRKKSLAMMQDAAKLARQLQANMNKPQSAGKSKQPRRFSAERRKTKFVRASFSMDDEDDEDDEGNEEEELRTQIRRLRSESTEDYSLNQVNFALKPPEDPYGYMKDIDTAALDNRHVSHKPLTPGAGTILILAKVHFEIALLYGTGRFEDENEEGSIDAESALFHICRSAGLGYGKACITLARLFMDLNIDDVCPGIDAVLQGKGGGRAEALILLKRAVSDDESAAAAVGMLLKYFKVDLNDDEKIGYCELLLKGPGGGDGPSLVVGDRVQAAYGGGETYYEAEVREVGDAGVKVFYIEDEEEEWLSPKYIKQEEGGGGAGDGPAFKVGEKVQAAYGGGETYYEAEVREVGDAGVKVFYIEDEEEEWLSPKYIKQEGGGAEKDDEANGGLESYELYEILGDSFNAKGDSAKACENYALGGEAAMSAGKMKKATELNMKAEG